MNLSDLLVPLRIVIGDQPIEGTTDNTDADLTASLKALFTMGMAPDCLTLNDDDTITPEPNGDAVGVVVIKTALVMKGGFSPTNIRTRALSMTTPNGERRDTLNHLRILLNDLIQDGDPCNEGGSPSFGVAHDMTTHLRSEFAEDNGANNDPATLL